MPTNDISIRLAFEEIGGQEAVATANRVVAALDKMPPAARAVTEATRNYLAAFTESQNLHAKLDMPQARLYDAETTGKQALVNAETALVQLQTSTGALAAQQAVLAEKEKLLLATERAKTDANNARTQAIADQQALAASKRRTDATVAEARIRAQALPAPERTDVIKQIDTTAQAAELNYLRQKQQVEERLVAAQKAAGAAPGLVTAAERTVQAAKEEVAAKAQAVQLAQQEVYSQTQIAAVAAQTIDAIQGSQAAAQEKTAAVVEEGQQLKINYRGLQQLTAEERARQTAITQRLIDEREEQRLLGIQRQDASLLKNVGNSIDWAADKSAAQTLAAAEQAAQLSKQAGDVKEQDAYKEVALTLHELSLEKQITEEVQKQAGIQKKPLGGGMAALPGTGTPVVSGGAVEPMVDLEKFTDDYLKFGNTGGRVTKDLMSNMRDFSIELRSVGSVMTGTGIQGGLYYFSQIGRNLQGAALAGAVAAFSIAIVTKSLIDLTARGLALQNITTAFNNLSSASGRYAGELVTQMQAAAQGTLSVGESMKIANVALLAGGEVFADKLPKLLEIARAAALATGQDITYTFNSLVTGIARGSPKLIDNANIYLKLGDANALYAQQLHKSVTELSAQEKQQATANAVILAGDEFMQRIGLSTQTTSEKIKSLGTAWKNFVDGIATGIAESGAMGGLAGYLEGLARRMEFERKSAANEATVRDLLQQEADLVALVHGTPFEGQLSGTREQIDALTAKFLAARQAYGATFSGTPTEIIANQDRYLAAVEKTPQEIAKEIVKWRELMSMPVDQKLLAIAGAQGQATATAIEATTVTEAYNDALAAISESKVNKTGKALADDIGKLKGLLSDFPEMPKLGDAVGVTDINALKLWAVEMDKALNLSKVTVSDQFSTAVAAIEKAQTSGVIAKFWEALTVGDDALLAAARAALGFGATVDDLVTKFDKLNPVTQDFLLRWGLVDAALNQIFDKPRKPIGFTGLTAGATDAVKQLGEWATALDKTGAHNAATKLRGPDTAALQGEIKANWETLAKLDAAGWQNWLATYFQGYQDYVDTVTAAQQTLLDLRKNLDNLNGAATAPLKPVLGESALTTDTGALQVYIAALAETRGAEDELVLRLGQSATALEGQQTALLATAASLNNPNEALQMLAERAFGAGKGVQDLIDNFKSLAPDVQTGVAALGLFNTALDDLVNKTKQPLRLDLAFDKVKTGIESIQALGLELGKYIDPQQAATATGDLVANYVAGAKQIAEQTKGLGQDVTTYVLQAYTSLFTGAEQSSVDYWEGEKQRAKEANKALKKDRGEVETGITAALNRGLTVTAGQMVDTIFGRYQETALENARRLAAIANNGFKELKAHPDWAKTLKIPDDVIGGTEVKLRNWAVKTNEDVRGLLRPDLIDWPGFLADWDKGVEEAKTKEWVMSEALSQLKITGRLDPKAEADAKKKIEKAFGLAEPEITFDAYFKEVTSADGVMNAVFDFLKNPDKPVQVALEMVTKWAQDPQAMLDNLQNGLTGAGRDLQTILADLPQEQQDQPYQQYLQKYNVKDAARPAESEYDYYAAYKAGITPAKWTDLPQSDQDADLRQIAEGKRQWFDTLSAYLWPDEFKLKDNSEPNSEDKLVGQLTKDKGYLEVPYQLTETKLSQANRAMLEGPAEKPPVVELQPKTGLSAANRFNTGELGVTPPVSKASSDLQTTAVSWGRDAAGSLYSSFEQAVAAQDVGALVADRWSKSFLAVDNQWRAIGATAGNQVAGAFAAAVEAGVGDVRQKLVNAVAGEVLKQADGRYQKKGNVLL